MISVQQLDISNIWVVEYSVLRDSWHVDTLDSVIEGNLEFCLTMEDRGSNDYKIVAMADTIEEAHTWLEKIKDKQQKIQGSKKKSGDIAE